MSENKEYKYVLKLIDGDNTVTSEFSGFANSEEMTYHLRDFLLGSGWSESTVSDILKLED